MMFEFVWKVLFFPVLIFLYELNRDTLAYLGFSQLILGYKQTFTVKS